VIRSGILMVLSFLFLAACSKDEVPDFCSNHAQFHAEHADSNAVLSVVMTADGRIDSEVRFPAATFDGDTTRAVLQDVSKVYALQTETECSPGESTLGSSEGMIIGGYTSSCGEDNKLGQVDVLLFDSLPSLNEVEVSVVTPATQKQFVINRQCESAIFRVE
jgi:hypothetical protein